MLTIWKFPVDVRRFTVPLPAGAQVLSVQVQGAQPVMWVLLDPSAAASAVVRWFVVYGTGWEVPANPGRFIGTFQLQGALVFHLFEEG